MKGLFLTLIFGILATFSASAFEGEIKTVKLVFVHFDNVEVELLVNGQEVVNQMLFDPDPSIGVSYIREINLQGCVEFSLKYGGQEIKKIILVDDEVGVIYIDSSQDPFLVQRGSSEVLVE